MRNEERSHVGASELAATWPKDHGQAANRQKLGRRWRSAL